VLGDTRHDAMTFIPPGMGRWWDDRHQRTARPKEQ
jgi:hypothetical protein